MFQMLFQMLLARKVTVKVTHLKMLTCVQVCISGVQITEYVHSPVTARGEIGQLQCQLNGVTVCFTNSAPVHVFVFLILSFYIFKTHIREAVMLCSIHDEN